MNKKQPYIKSWAEFDKVAKEYGFSKRDIDEIYEHWHKRIGNVEVEVYRHQRHIHICKKGISCWWAGKNAVEKYLKNIEHLIEWR